MILDPQTMEWQRQLAAQRQAYIRNETDTFINGKQREQKRNQHQGEITRLRDLILAAVETAYGQANPEARFDGFHLGNPMHLAFTDIKEGSPSEGHSFTVNLYDRLLELRCPVLILTADGPVPLEPEYDICALCGDQTTFTASAEIPLCPHCEQPKEASLTGTHGH